MRRHGVVAEFVYREPYAIRGHCVKAAQAHILYLFALIHVFSFAVNSGVYRASDFFEKFHIRTLFGSFYINCSVIYRYILVKRHLDIKNCPTAQLLHYAAGHYNFVICRRARRFQHQRLWSNPRQGRRRESFSRRESQGCSADICEAVLRRKRDRIRGR